MRLAALVVIVGDAAEVIDILGHNGTLLVLGQREQIRIRPPTQISALDHRFGVVATVTQLLGDRRGVHLVEQ